MIYLYRQPEPGEQIVIGADPAEGGDNSAFVAISKKHTDVIMLSKSKEESPQMGYSLNHIGKWFNKMTGNFPIIAVERNTGVATIHILKENNYPALYKTPESFIGTKDKEQEKYGWYTTAANRQKMLDDLALAIRIEAIKIPSQLIIDEMFTFIRHEKTNKPQADIGCNDDLVMALAIGWQVYQTHSPVFSQENEMVYGKNYYDINQDSRLKWGKNNPLRNG